MLNTGTNATTRVSIESTDSKGLVAKISARVREASQSLKHGKLEKKELRLRKNSYNTEMW